MDFKRLALQGRKTVGENSPIILAAISVVGTLTTALLTGKATLRAVDLLDAEDENWRQMSGRDRAKLVWKEYIPPVTCGLITIGCIVGANRIGTRRAAALASAYTLSEKAFGEYREKVVTKLGEPKERAVRDEVAQDRITKNPPPEDLVEPDGDVLCYEVLTDRYFFSTMEKLRRAENDINYKINQEQYASHGDWCNAAGLPQAGISDLLGWNGDALLAVQFSSVIAPSGRPAISIDFENHPVQKYYRAWT